MKVTFLSNLSYYIPELIAIFTMCGLLLMEAAYKPREKGRLFIYIAGAIGLVCSLVSLGAGFGENPVAIFSSALIIDNFSTFSKIIMVLGTLGSLFIAYNSKDIQASLKAEYVILAMGVLVGGMLLASANNMLTLYLGVETLSILSYVMAAMKREDVRSSESGLKYVLYGGVSAGVMLFGISHIYGILGTIQFQGVAELMAQVSGPKSAALMISFILFYAGIGYKIASVPFHMWSPDVYQGSPIPVTTFFSIVPKVAGIAAIMRVSMVFFGQENALQSHWIALLQVIAALTMTVGNVTAIGQDSMKRLLAYSSIAHAGNMLLGVVVLNEIGSKAILFYGMTYVFMTLTAFYVTSFIADKYSTDSVTTFRGLIQRHPIVAIAMTLTLYSLAGLPPFSGFIAKFNIFSAVINKGYYTLAVIAGINSVISLYYYMRVVKIMIFDAPEDTESIPAFGFFNQMVISIVCLPVLILGLFWNGLIAAASGAKIFIN